MPHNIPSQVRMAVLLEVYMRHLHAEEGTDFLYHQDQRDYVAAQANLSLEDKLWFEDFVAKVHSQPMPGD